MESFSTVKERIEHGTSMCPVKQYPFMVFKCGLLFNKLPNISRVITFMETIEYLKAEKKLTETFQGHLISFLYDNPEMEANISDILDSIIRNKPVNILIELEKLQQMKQANSGDGQNGSVPDATKQQHNNCSEAKKLTKNGTVVMATEQQVIQADNESQKTEKYDEEYFENVIKMNQQSQALAKKLQEEEERMAKSQLGDDTTCEICYVGLYDE